MALAREIILDFKPKIPFTLEFIGDLIGDSGEVFLETKYSFKIAYVSGAMKIDGAATSRIALPVPASGNRRYRVLLPRDTFSESGKKDEHTFYLAAGAAIDLSELIEFHVTPVSTIQSTLNAKQDKDADLTTIAALSPSNDDILQRKAGAWINRTPAQLKTDLGVNLVDNTPDANKPVSAAQAAADAAATASAISAIRNGVDASGNDLNKLHTQILAHAAIIGGAVPDGDSTVTTVTELLKVFENFSESVNLLTKLNEKAEKTEIAAHAHPRGLAASRRLSDYTAQYRINGDDSPAIQAMINDLPIIGGQIILDTNCTIKSEIYFSEYNYTKYFIYALPGVEVKIRATGKNVFYAGNSDILFERLAVLGNWESEGGADYFDVATLFTFNVCRVRFKDCEFLGIVATVSILQTSYSNVSYENTHYRACWAPYSTLINCENAFGFSFKESDIFDIGTYRGFPINRAILHCNRWIKISTANPLAAGTQGVILFEKCNFDEGASIPVEVDGFEFVSIKQTFANVWYQGADTAAFKLKNIRSGVIEQCWAGIYNLDYPGTMPFAIAENCGRVKFISCTAKANTAAVQTDDFDSIVLEDSPTLFIDAPPTVPAGLTLQLLTVNSIRASWTASVDAGAVAGYELRVNGGTPIDVGNVLIFDLTNLIADTLYNIEVRAKDADYYSAWSPVASRTTTFVETILHRINAGGGAIAPYSADSFFLSGAIYGEPINLDTSHLTVAPPLGTELSFRYSGGQMFAQFTGLDAAKAHKFTIYGFALYPNADFHKWASIKANSVTKVGLWDLAEHGVNVATERTFTVDAGETQILLEFDNAGVAWGLVYALTVASVE